VALLAAQRGRVSQLAKPFAIMAAFVLAVLVVHHFWSRRETDRSEARPLLVAIVATAVVGGVVLQSLVLLFLPVAPFHGFYTWRVRSSEERSPTRPHVTYRYNSLGFRGPEWTMSPGVTRIALIGDSYVFGSGVEAEDTLDRRLAARLEQTAPDRPYEVLNLGIPGDNIASHVRLYAIAAEYLDVASAVIALTLPNDLSRLEPPEQIGAVMRPSATGLAMYLFGPAWVTVASDALSLESLVNDAGLAWLDVHLAEIERIQERFPRTRLSLFCFQTPDPRISEVFSRHPTVRLIASDPEQDDARNYIPGDGHPNAEGNRLFSRIIARGL
jgi:hypothetical protein